MKSYKRESFLTFTFTPLTLFDFRYSMKYLIFHGVTKCRFICRAAQSTSPARHELYRKMSFGTSLISGDKCWWVEIRAEVRTCRYRWFLNDNLYDTWTLISGRNTEIVRHPIAFRSIHRKILCAMWSLLLFLSDPRLSQIEFKWCERGIKVFPNISLGIIKIHILHTRTT